MTKRTKNIQFQLVDKEIDSFEKLFKKSGFRNISEYMRYVYFTHVKAANK